MTDLSDFLLARIAEDEAVARGATVGSWEVRPYWFTSDGHSWATVPDVINEDIDATDAEHIARWDPVRVLAECDAKRRIVAEHPIYRGPRIVAVDTSSTDYGCELCHCIEPTSVDGAIEANGYCETLRLLAPPYADHPDYLEEWRP